MTACTPFLRWPGGKRWLIPHLQKAMARFKIDRYFEPFLGGGAIFFSQVPKSAILSDSNLDLINAYQAVQTNPQELIRIIKELPPTKEFYYHIRSIESLNCIDRAAYFIYLNRLAFSGMYRVNRLGQFNVPFGGDRKLSSLWTDSIIEKSSAALQGATIEVVDFETQLDQAGTMDLVYCDPTYTVAHNDNGFIRYNEKVFSWEDQIRLAKAALRAKQRGAIVIISNAAHHEIAKLYRPKRPTILSRYSSIATQQNNRKFVDEFLFILK